MPYNYTNYNSYLNGNPFLSNQQPLMQMQAQNQPIQQINNQQQTNYTTPNDYPISIKFATEAEALSHIPMPNTRIMFMDRNNNVFWIKWADSMGTAGIEKYEFRRVDNTNETQQKKENNIDTSMFVKQEDISKFGFITQTQFNDTLNSFKKEIETLRKEINLKKIIQDEK